MSEELIPRKRRKVTLNVEHLLNDIFVDEKDRDRGNVTEPIVKNIEGDERVAGKIESIKLQNFMCHSNLEFNFGEKINFISGKNGSGKSAILTALVVGLGGRTADTNRGQSIKSLIQNGKHRASIEITLNNTEPTKFKPHRYGNSIKVVRLISGSSSQYKILSENGEVISTKRDDIDVINMFFNIQVNNPVTILNQDTARTFIKSAAPKDLYNIFMRGTHLEEIEIRNLSLKTEKIPALEKLIDEKKNVLQESYKEIRKYKEKLEKVKELQKYQDKATDIENELYWAYANKTEQKLIGQRDIEKEIEKQLPQLRDKVNRRDKIEQELQDKQKSSESRLKELKSKSREVEREALELERSLRNSKEQIAGKMNEMKTIKKKIETEKNCCKEIQSEIDNHESRSAEVEAKKTRLQTLKQELEKRLGELKAVRSTTYVHRQQLSDTKDAASTSYSQKEQFYSNLKNKLAYKEDNLKSLKTEKNQLMVYSKWMPELVDNIEKAFKAGKFRKKPRGPLGSFIQLKEKKWGPAIEKFIGAKTLSSFCVDNNDDYKILKQITSRINMPPNMIPPTTVSKFIEKVHDVSKGETGDSRYQNLLRSLKISDPIATNALIDAIEPEYVLLIPTSEEAYGLLEDVQNVPRNCKRAFTLNGDLFFPAPNYRSYAGSVDGTTRYLQVSQAQAIKFAEQEVSSIKEELMRLKDGLEKAKLEVSRSAEQLDEVNSEVFKLNQQITACENKLDEMKREELPVTYDVHLLKQDLEYRQKNFETAEDTMKMLESGKDELLVKYREIKDKFEKNQALKTEMNEEINTIETEISDLNQEFHKLSTRSDLYISRLKSEEAKLNSVRENIVKLEKEFHKAEQEAKEAHPERIKDTKDIEFLEKDLQKLQSMKKALENIIGDVNVIPDDYSERVKQLQEKHETLQNLTRTTNKLKEVVHHLDDVYRKVKELVTLNTKHSFLSMLNKKKFSGDLIIDHNKKTLKVIIKVESAANDKSSTLTLSGGERSYSMVSFIMALWNNMYSPFFFLDEFDVFMDEINRNMIMSMLLNHAKTRPDQQFVFLTPHANLNNELLKDVQFFRMNDPRSQDAD